jgi:hypothetical protein
MDRQVKKHFRRVTVLINQLTFYIYAADLNKTEVSLMPSHGSLFLLVGIC